MGWIKQSNVCHSDKMALIREDRFYCIRLKADCTLRTCPLQRSEDGLHKMQEMWGSRMRQLRNVSEMRTYIITKKEKHHAED